MALKYSDGSGTELPADQQIPMRTDTIFDMASVSKLFTSIVVMQLVEKGKVGLDTPIATYVPEFAQNGKEAITVRQALTHTTGLPAWLPLWSAQPDPASRMQMALTAKPTSVPGTTYLYSDLNLISLGEVAHRVTGKTLDKLVADGITKPLQMRDTGYNPDREEEAADRRHGVPDGPAAGHGVGFGARRERVVAGRCRRARRGVLDRRRPGRAGTDVPERRQLPRRADPQGELGHRDDHELQPGLPGQRPRARFRAEPALVHGRPVGSPHGRPHRLHRARRS